MFPKSVLIGGMIKLILRGPFLISPAFTTTMIFAGITVMFTVLSVSLALQIHGDIIRGYPCVSRHNQLYCSTPGANYPSQMIDTFIDEHKALLRRMFGEFHAIVDSSEEEHEDTTQEESNEPRNIRHTTYNISVGRWERAAKPFATPTSANNRIDSCESSVEIVTPYWANNSAGKIRAIVNTQHFEQAVQQETCQNVSTKRCAGDCGCEQKFKWHRLMAYDPQDNCKGIFMDWFLFPSCCVCKCTPISTNIPNM